jgi:hypothetical protein
MTTMAGDWKAWCEHRGWSVRGRIVTVRIADGGRRHRVRVQETDSTFEIEAVIPGYSRSLIECWDVNRSLTLASLGIGTDEGVWMYAWIPKTGLDADEFCEALLRLAIEADRREHEATGTDEE